MKKNLLITTFVVGLIGIFSLPTMALDATPAGRQKVEEKLVDKAEKLIDKVLPRAALISGTIVTNDKTNLTVSKDGKTYNILIDSNTKLRRRFWGKATLAEMQVGDIVNVHGKWVDSTKTGIRAALVRDMSIQKRNGVFVGKVTALISTGWTMETVNRGKQTVMVVSTTKYVNRKEQVITNSDIQVGDRVRVRGLWDQKSNTISEVQSVKDYSLPVKTSTATSSGTNQ